MSKKIAASLLILSISALVFYGSSLIFNVSSTEGYVFVLSTLILIHTSFLLGFIMTNKK